MAGRLTLDQLVEVRILCPQLLNTVAKRYFCFYGPIRQVNETEAEATAFIVCEHFGIETNAPNYLAH